MSQMSPEARQHLRKVARQRDSSQADARFRLAQAETDIAEGKERRIAADRAKEKAAERQEFLEEFKPTLSLNELQDHDHGGLKGFTAERIKNQIRWHRSIGNDSHIPTGVSKMKKAAAWIVMVRAVRRHLRGTSSDEGTF